MRRRAVSLLMIAFLGLQACGDPSDGGSSSDDGGGSAGVATATGVVIAVDGDLSTVDLFTIRAPDGSDTTFTVRDDARFDGGPMGHIRDHLRSGAPVTVEYTVEDGAKVARDVADGTDR